MICGLVTAGGSSQGPSLLLHPPMLTVISLSTPSLLETGKEMLGVSVLIWAMSWGSPTLGAKFLHLSGWFQAMRSSFVSWLLLGSQCQKQRSWLTLVFEYDLSLQLPQFRRAEASFLSDSFWAKVWHMDKGSRGH